MFHIFNLQLIPSPFCPSRYIALIRRIVQSEYIDVVSSSYLVKWEPIYDERYLARRMQLVGFNFTRFKRE